MCISSILIFNSVYIIINIYYLQYYSFNYTDFFSNNNITTNNNNNYDNEKEKLKSDLAHYKTEYEKLKKENNKLQDENTIFHNELIKINKIIAEFSNNTKDNNNLNEITNLKNIICNKDKEIINLKNIIVSKESEIMNLKLQLQNNNVNKQLFNIDDVMVINFYSEDKNINYGIKCLKTDTFAEVEEKLYQKYPDYRNTNNNFVAKERIVLRFKKIFENGIIDGDKIQLIKIE